MEPYIIWNVTENHQDTYFRSWHSLEVTTLLCSMRNFDTSQIFEPRLKKSTIEKIIPGIPLDPTLPILQAGYIQDRARKRYRQDKL